MKEQQHNDDIVTDIEIINKLSEDQFIEITLEVNYLMLHNRKISSGLAWFSVLKASYPKLAKAIEGTKYDPSTDNKNLDNFYAFVKGF